MRAEAGTPRVVAAVLILLFASDAAAGPARYVSPFVTSRLARILEWVDADEHERALEALADLDGRVRPGSGDDVLVTRQRVSLLGELGRYDEARALLLETLGEDPGPELAALLLLLGQYEALRGDFAAADRALIRWLDLDGDPSPQGLFLAGYVAFRQEDYPRAAEQIGGAMAATEFVPARWVEVQAFALLRSGREAEAEALLEDRIGRYPSEAGWWRILARLALDADRLEDAAVRMAVLDAAERLAPAESRRLAGLLAGTGQPERGARLLAASLAAPDRANAGPDDLMTLARLWIAAREWEEAVRTLEAAADRTEEAEPLVVLGQTHLHWERYEAALEALEAAQAREGETPSGRTAWLLAIAAWNLGRLDTAERALRIARNAPGHEAQAERLLRQLRDG
jgi:tetratricopeptide (TPR) repeat protein